MTDHPDRDIDEIASESLDQSLDVSRLHPPEPPSLEVRQRAANMARARELLRDVSPEESVQSLASKFDAMVQHALDAGGESASFEDVAALPDVTALPDTSELAAVPLRSSAISSHRSAWIGAAAAVLVLVAAAWVFGGRGTGDESADMHTATAVTPEAAPSLSSGGGSGSTGRFGPAPSTTAIDVPAGAADGEPKGDVAPETSAEAPSGSVDPGPVGLGDSVRLGLLELIEWVLAGHR